MDGFINVNKPQNMTSHDVVAIVRRTLPGRLKVGHTGTLDPNATGVLPICVGKATRLAEYVQDLPKTYIGEITFGIITDTLDIWGNVEKKNDASALLEADFRAVLPRFVGEIEQLPPMVSAVKIGGERLYNLARAGVQVERKSRRVQIFALDVLSCNWQGEHPRAVLRVCCSSGTYIRTLFADIGEILGVGACLSDLVRSQVGSFVIDNSISLEALKESVSLDDYSFIMDYGFGIAHLPSLKICDTRLLNGLTSKTNAPVGSPYAVFNYDGNLWGIGSVTAGAGYNWLKLDKVLAEPFSKEQNK